MYMGEFTEEYIHTSYIVVLTYLLTYCMHAYTRTYSTYQNLLTPFVQRAESVI